jgi:hypothetical protein
MLGLDDWSGVQLRERRAWAGDGRSVTLEAIALHSLHQDQQRQIMHTASYVSYESPPPFAGQFVEVLVDTQTGQVTVEKMVMAVDAGVVINPLTASGQVEGGMVQALGYAHCEEMAYDENGRMVNPTFGPYKIYRADEMPKMDVILVQTHEPSGPFGAKAIAEIPKDGVAPALSNAVFDATGVRIRQIPFTPERVWWALRNQKCPCAGCGFYTIGLDYFGSYNICPLCDWEDDGMQLANPACGGGANLDSLIEHQQQYISVFPIEVQVYDSYQRDPSWRVLNQSEIDEAIKEKEEKYWKNQNVFDYSEAYWAKK